jgi:hypothetical protein
MDEENDDVTPEDLAAIFAAALGEPEEVVQPTPWSSYDTTAVAMMFAANISLAAGDFFRNLAILALGQSANDIEIEDNKQFSESMLRTLGMIPETKDGDE